MTLKLCGGDLETTDFHDLLEPINDEEVVILVDDDFVSRFYPSKIKPVSLQHTKEHNKDLPVNKRLLRT